MPPRLNDLLPASFKGIDFYVRAEVMTEGGRRIVLHDYPNSSERFVEDLGQLPPKFSITAFVSGPDYLSRADQLERALQEKGKGRLSMPNFGARTVFALAYRKDATQIAVGEIRFELSFTAGKAISGPARVPDTVETVYSKGDDFRGVLGEALNLKWIEPSQTNNVQTAIYDLKQVVVAIESLYTSLSNISEIESLSNFINLNAPTIVRSKNDMQTVLVDRLLQLVSTGLSGGQGIPELLDLTNFGSGLSLSLSDIRSASVQSNPIAESTNVPLWPESTAERVTRNSNRMSVVNAVRTSALSMLYEQSSDATYDNDSQLDDTRKSIESEHSRLMNDDTDSVDFLQSQPDVRFAMEDLRLSALNVLDDKEQSTFTLTTIRENVSISSFVLAYNLYAEDFETSQQIDDRAINIRNLNPTQPSDKLVKDITVLQT